MMSDGPSKFNATPIIMLAFIALGCGALYLNNQGYLDRPSKEVLKDLTQFEHCEVNSYPVSNGLYLYDKKELECNFTAQQKNNEETLARAMALRNKVTKEFSKLQESAMTQIETALKSQNSKKNPEKTVTQIMDKVQDFESCKVSKKINTNESMMKCILSDKQLYNDGTFKQAKADLNDINFNIEQLDENSITNISNRVKQIREAKEVSKSKILNQ